MLVKDEEKSDENVTSIVVQEKNKQFYSILEIVLGLLNRGNGA